MVVLKVKMVDSEAKKCGMHFESHVRSLEGSLAPWSLVLSGIPGAPWGSSGQGRRLVIIWNQQILKNKLFFAIVGPGRV